MKEDLRRVKKEVLQCMVNNINDQNGADSLAAAMSAFDLDTNEGLEERSAKVEVLHTKYGIERSHQMESW